MASKLDQLKTMTTIVADTGDMEAIRAFKPTDSTTNPSLILKAAQMKGYGRLIDEAVEWGRKARETASAVVDRINVNFGEELTKIVPGRVSTEIDADLSFDTDAMLGKARHLIASYEARGVKRDRILVKLASTWEGMRAAKVLQAEGIDCNMTLLFSMAQARAAADAKAFLISPFVGRILDWYQKSEGKTFEPKDDPGVKSVAEIYRYYKANGIKTIVMGASFRSTGEIEELAGCDRLTISPELLEKLSKDEGTLVRKLEPGQPSGKGPPPVIDEPTFRLDLNADAMATEKLADGIRNFTKDLKTLQGLVEQRLAKAA